MPQPPPPSSPWNAYAADDTPATPTAARWNVFAKVRRALGVVAARREIEVEREHPRRAEAGVDLEQVVDAANEEAGADEQQERQRDLRHDQRLAQPRLLVDDGAAASS